jgi:hypothetical protein
MWLEWLRDQMLRRDRELGELRYAAGRIRLGMR